MHRPELYNYTTDMFQTHALAWMENHVAAAPTKPFFLYLAFTVPHAGGWGDDAAESGAPVPTDGRYASQTGWPDVEKDHAGVITYLDGYVGQVMDKIDALGIANNTVLFFASDNGAHLEGGHSYTFFNSTGGLRGHKRSMFEGGVRSPTMVRWPNMVEAGAVSDHQWAFWDLMPTMAEIAGVEGISAVPSDIDGHSILPTLRGQAQAPRIIYFTGNNMWGRGGDGGHVGSSAVEAAATAYSIRFGKWKAVATGCQGTPSSRDVLQLYDLSSDPFETKDLSASEMGKRQLDRLKAAIAQEKGLSCKCYQC
jgi:arylsulfatase A-like enzyme